MRNKKENIQQPYVPENQTWNLSSGSHVDSVFATGTWPQVFSYSNPKPTGEFDIEELWEKMYTRMLRVIVTCKYCLVPQTVDNGTCMRCGAPLPKPTRLGE